MAAENFERPRTDAGNAIQPVERAEGAVAFAIFQDARGEGGPYARQPRQLFSRRAIDVDLLAPAERPREPY